MSSLQQTWQMPFERPQVLRSGTIEGRPFWAMTGAAGAAAFGDAEGKVLFSVERYRARGAVITAGHVVFLLKNVLMAFSADGERKWRVPLEAGSVGRIFAGARGDVVILLSRRKRFVAERYDVASGEYIDTKPIERRRGLLGESGAHLWTRDRKGITCFDMMGPGIRRVALAGNGPVSERGMRAITTVGGEEVVCVMGDEVRWRTRVEGRDLSEAARLDGLEVNEDEYESPLLGRALLSDEAAFVPDANGVLHALSLNDGEKLWRFEGDHYPTMEQARRPVFFGETIAFPCSDEYVYSLDAKGGRLGETELPGPTPVDPVVCGDALLVYADALRAYGP